jgi:hypothetical protein
LSEQPGCIAHWAVESVEHSAAVPEHAVQVQPLDSQMALMVWVLQASGGPLHVPGAPGVQVQPPIMLHDD